MPSSTGKGGLTGVGSQGRNLPVRLRRESLKTHPHRRLAIRARQQNKREPLMYPVVASVFPELLHRFAEAVESTHSTSHVMESGERLFAESHSTQSLDGFATIPRVTAGVPCLAQDTVHDGSNITAIEHESDNGWP